jgi:flagellar biosynthesis/type III secretory pathway protein FliH
MILVMMELTKTMRSLTEMLKTWADLFNWRKKELESFLRKRNADIEKTAMQFVRKIFRKNDQIELAAGLISLYKYNKVQ